MQNIAEAFMKIKLFEQEVVNLKRKLNHLKKAYANVFKKNETLVSTVRDLRNSFVKLGTWKLFLKLI